MSWNKFDYSNKNRFIIEEYNEDLDKKFEEEFGLDIDEELVDWEE